MDRSRHNLADALTSFVGREREIAQGGERLRTARLVTLIGAGGVGKTRLARRIGFEVLGAYPGGVWLVELAPLADPATIPGAIAVTLGVREEPGRDVVETVAGAIAARQHLLLILDNCEHLVEGAAAVVERLLGACPGLTILATSREALGVDGEIVRRVPSLSVPSEAAVGHPEIDSAVVLGQHDATRLFVDRAQAVHDGFLVTPDNADAIAQICRRLDGIPLAIELAAARARVLTPRQIAARLDDRFSLLTDGSRIALPRQRTLRATIDWSYDLLAEPEQAMLRRLAVFAGGCTLEAVETVASDLGDTLDLLGRLVDKSLVTADLSGVESRYSLLETIRAYALERLTEGGEAAATRDRHAAYFLALAERIEPELHGPDQAVWVDRLEAENDNFRAAFAWTLGAGDDPVTTVQLAAALGWFWFVRSYLSETRWLEAALAATDDSTADLEVIRSRARCFCHLGWLGRTWNDPPRAVALGERSLALSRAIGDRAAVGYTLTVVGMLLRDLRDYPRARAAAEEGIAIARELGESRTLAHGLYVLASILWYERFVPVQSDSTGERSADDHPEARERRDRSEARPSQARPPHMRIDLSDDPSCQEGIVLLEESLAISRRLGDTWGMGVTLTGGGALAAHCTVSGELARAREVCTESLELFWQIRDLRSVSVALRCCAHLALAEGEPRRAACLIAAFRRTFETIGAVRQAAWPSPELEMAALRSQLSDADVEAAWVEGLAMTPEQATAYALRRVDPFRDDQVTAGAPSPHLPASAARTLSVLTPREQEVAVLVGQGYSNRRIAEVLVLSQRTVDSHVRNIMGKLESNTRAQIAAWVAQRGLLTDDERR
jgi:predicted ATPase/DNA-binding CsgD family transcriptional regulator